MRTFLAFMLAIFGLPALAAPPGDLPPELSPWVGWVLDGHPELRCPQVGGSTACAWPGELALALGRSGGDFTQQVTVDRELAVPLPGTVGAWPTAVKVDGKDAVVRDVGGRPMVTLQAGSHRIQGRLSWTQRPQSLELGPLVGLVDLVVDGAAVPFPRISSEGTLQLGGDRSAEAGEDRLDLDVSRKVSDGVPVVVETLVRLRASGRAREVDLGPVLLPGTRPVRLDADLPARFDAEGHLDVQLRAGSFELRFQAIHEGPASELRRPEAGELWPERETWAVQTDDQVRAVNVGGPPSVDPARTSLPAEWHGLATFLVGPTEVLQIEELRRGEPEPPPNRITLDRTFYLDASGKGITTRDRLQGEVNRGWRLDVQEPAALGHVAVSGEDQVITTRAGAAGVELRESNLDLQAESRLPSPTQALPAVGWDTDVQSLSINLQLPPGWALLAATGVDSASGSLLEEWTLFDLFFVLVLTLAIGRLLGPRWGLVALTGLVLSRHLILAPSGLIVLVVVALAVERGLARTQAAAAATWARRGAGLLLLLWLVPFAVDDVEAGLFPVTARSMSQGMDSGGSYGWGMGGADMDMPTQAWEQGTKAEAPPQEQAMAERKPSGTSDDYYSDGIGLSSLSRSAPKKKAFLSMQQDPTAVVQTGPGVPTWTWESAWLSWSGPVHADQELRLWLLSPVLMLGLALVRVLALLALSLRLAGLRLPGRPGPGLAAATALLVALVVPTQAQAAPSSELLAELEARLTQAAPCRPDCVTVSELQLTVQGGNLTVEATVHVEALSAWPLPGPAVEWAPASVSVDGRPTAAVARLSDGFLNVRLEPGVHRVVARGPLPPTDALPLRFGLAPKRVAFEGRGWEIGGLKADGTAEAAVQLTRSLEAASGTPGVTRSSENLGPFVEVHRSLDLGIPWRVRTTVSRRGPSERPVALSVPLLPGEAVTTEGFEVDSDRIRVTLDRDQLEASWDATLAESELIELRAPEGVKWTERWSLSCSPVYACAPESKGELTTLLHAQDGRWLPEWRPWPGEQLSISVSRPEAVAGQTLTMDGVTLEVTPGRRLLEGSLSMSIRTSQGGQQPIRLPPEASLRSVTIDGQQRPLQAREGVVAVPVRPGSQQVVLTWQQPTEPSLLTTLPAVDLGTEAVNVHLIMQAPEDRWLLWTVGPSWGPVALLWVRVLLIALLALLVARLRHAHLATWQWLLLGLGFVQLPWVFTFVVIGWFLLLDWRSTDPKLPTGARQVLQLAIPVLTMVFLMLLLGAVYTGLVSQPDPLIQGNGSSASTLRWYVDRSGGQLDQPGVLSLPLWSWRVAMLLWALWLAASLVRWMPWAWRAWTAGGIWTRGPAPSSTSPAPTEHPSG